MDVFKTLILDTPDSLENITGVLAIANGGTGADNASDARDNLGLGTIATQDANAVAITGGSVTGLTSLSVDDNTTLGSSNSDTVDFNARIASEFTPATNNTYDLGRVGHAWNNLYLGGTAIVSSLAAGTADINGGTIDGTAIGATTPAAGTFSQVNSDGAIIAVGAGSFGDDTDVTGDFTVTGSVGIGTAGSPGKKLHIASNATSQTTATIPGIRIENLDTTTVNTDVSGEIEFFSKDASETDKISGFIKNVAEDAGTKYGLSFGAKTNGSNATEAMRINHAGDVGIGLTNPAEKLSVAGGNLNLDDNYSLNWSAAPGRPYIVGSKASDFIKLGTPSGGDLLNLVSTSVGIGTTAPSARLEISNEQGGARGRILLDANVSSGYETRIDATDTGLEFTTVSSSRGFVFNTGSTPTAKVNITAAGNVGVGTAAPDSKLHVRNDGTDAILAKFESDIGVNTRDFRIKSPVLDSTTYPFRFTTSNSFAFEVDGVENLRIHSNGNVGVGTTAPTAKFVVAGGGAAIQGEGFPTTGAGWEFYTNSVNGSWAQSYSRTSSAWLDAHWNALTHRYSTSGTERMRITSGGDVILSGTTMPTVGVGGFAWDNVNDYVRFGKMGAGVQTQAIFISATQTCGTITTNQTSTAYNTSSDYRLKENVVPMSDALQRIGNLKPSRFNFIADDSVVVDGFIAHEVQEVVPEAISGEKDAMREEEYEVTPAVLDDDGNEITPAVMDTRSVPEYQGIDQSKLVPLLVGAVQELTARLEALENN